MDAYQPKNNLTDDEDTINETFTEYMGCHRLGASGCYTVAIILAVVTMFALWRYQFHPSEWLTRFILLTITSMSGTVFLWLLLIKKW